MNNTKLRRQAIGLLAGYALQFLAGMLLNLFVTIPTKHPGDSGSNYLARSWHSLVWTLSGHGGWELAFHVYLGCLLVVGSISLFTGAAIRHNTKWLVAGGVAALFTIGAFFNGMSFIDFNKDISSMIMATCWLAAVSSLVAACVLKAKSSERTNLGLESYKKLPRDV
jgi:hypothetical protein